MAAELVRSQTSASIAISIWPGSEPKAPLFNYHLTPRPRTKLPLGRRTSSRSWPGGHDLGSQISAGDLRGPSLFGLSRWPGRNWRVLCCCRCRCRCRCRCCCATSRPLNSGRIPRLSGTRHRTPPRAPRAPPVRSDRAGPLRGRAHQPATCCWRRRQWLIIGRQ